MSRKELVGEEFTVTFGLDHVTGPFIQVWQTPSDDQDMPIVGINSWGSLYFEAGAEAAHKELGEGISKAVRDIERRWSPERNVLAPQDIDMVVVAAGFESHLQEIYRMLD